MTETANLRDDIWLDTMQRAAFDYFAELVDPNNGLVPDTSRANSPVSIAVVGFALSTYPVAVERGWMSRTDALRHSLTALRFFRHSDQSGTAQATGYKGFYYHFLDMRSGTRVWESELSMIDTALLIAGVLTASTYFARDTKDEIELRNLADFLYRRIDWEWARNGGRTINQGWKPESGFLDYGWEGYSEAIVLYVLALGSPTHPIGNDCYAAWTSTYQWENLYDCDYLYAGPLFVHHFSHAWIDLRDIRDDFMREKDFDYFRNSCNAVEVQRRYTQLNPFEFVGYDENCWGLSAGDGPSDERTDVFNEDRRLFGYAARGVPYGPDDGTLSPSAVLASLPFAPAPVFEAMHNMLAKYPQILTHGRLTSTFNASVGASAGQPWVSAGHYGLDQGIVVMMIENYRNGFIWQLTRSCPYICNGLQRAGFDGGWLQKLPCGEQS